MIVGIHQPNFIPWLGYFYKILKSDIFIILDDVQYTKNSFINRNKIKTPNNSQWLTLPVKKQFGQLINEVEIIHLESTKKKILKTLKANYGKSIYYNEIISLIEPLFVDKILSKLNETFVKNICDYLEIKTDFIRSSELNTQHFKSTEKLIQLCKEVNATSYLCGLGGKKYQDSDLFDENNIKLITSDFVHPKYSQLWGAFIPNLSIIDMLFNCGKKSKDHLVYGYFTEKN